MDWKRSRLIIAVTSSAATVVFMISIYSELVIPTYIEKYKTKLQRYEYDIENIDKLRSRVLSAEEELQEYKNENRAIYAELKTLHGKNPFRNKNVIPIGYRDFSVGKEITELKVKYPFKSIQWEERYVSVDIESELFSELTMYFDKTGDKKIIRGLMFKHKRSGQKSAYHVLELLKSEFGNIDFVENTYSTGELAEIEIASLSGCKILINSLIFAITKA